MQDKPKKSGEMKMRPRARLIKVLGDELISDEPIALVELVKNAYDADASFVKISFEEATPKRPSNITVVDDGIGMDLNTVLHEWLEPGTVMKKTNKISPGGRAYQGSKGIGRFAAARLANFLLLESKTEDSSEGVSLLLDWGSFDDKSYLDEINIDYNVQAISQQGRGTSLTLDGLRKEWTEEDYDTLINRLSRLIAPFRYATDFRIDLETPGYPAFSGKVEPHKIIQEPIYQLKGKLDNSGEFIGELQIEGKGKKEISRKILAANDKPKCGPFSVEIKAWDRDREGLDPIMHKHNMKIRKVRAILDAYCGVSIYRDEFRVHPYGEKSDDWLGLDLRSRQNPVRNLANNQLIATIRISSKQNPQLQDRSTREGMIINSAYQNLADYFKKILTLLEEQRYKERPRTKNFTSQVGPLFEGFNLKETIQQAKKNLGKDHVVTHLITEDNQRIQEGIKRIQETYSRLLMLSGLGHMVDIVIHEIGAPLGKITGQISLLEKELSSLSDKDLKREMPSHVESIKRWLAQLHSLRQRLDPQTPAKRGRATSFDVKDEVKDNFSLYEILLKKQNIHWEPIFPQEKIQVTMLRSCLGQILANLIDNSIFWLIKEKGAGKGGKIQVKLDLLDKGFRLLFSDNGPGVPEEDRSIIFDPYFSTKPMGTGLGLYIARLVIEPYGKLIYHDNCALSGACFEARFERKTGQ